jgi:hypothetical protein
MKDLHGYLASLLVDHISHYLVSHGFQATRKLALSKIIVFGRLYRIKAFAVCDIPPKGVGVNRPVLLGAIPPKGDE